MNILIVGAGFYGLTIGRLLTNIGHNCKIIDRRNHIGGNCYDKPIESNNKIITIHKYGPHIFHTSNEKVIDFISKYMKLNSFVLNIIAKDDKNKIYHLPFNMNTFYDVFGTSDIFTIKSLINKEIRVAGLINKIPENLEEKAIQMVGTTIYNTLIKNYTEKQWNKKCTELSPDIIKRLPLRYYYDNSYHDIKDQYRGIPIGGYTKVCQNIIDGIEGENKLNILLGIDFKDIKEKYDKIIYCGAIDELLEYKFGPLQWRSLKFENIEYEFRYEDSMGTAQTNLVGTQRGTRIIDHIYFTPENLEEFIGKKTIQTLEIPDDWEIGKERYYSINNEESEDLYNKYVEECKKIYPNIILGGRLGKYKYLDMDKTILEAIKDFECYFSISS